MNILLNVKTKHFFVWFLLLCVSFEKALSKRQRWAPPLSLSLCRLKTGKKKEGTDFPNSFQLHPRILPNTPPSGLRLSPPFAREETPKKNSQKNGSSKKIPATGEKTGVPASRNQATSLLSIFELPLKEKKMSIMRQSCCAARLLMAVEIVDQMAKQVKVLKP